MALLLFTLLFLAIPPHSSATWCVCKQGLDTKVIQKTLDYACGAGANCEPIHQTGPCFNPDTVKDHCDYAVNSYFQRNKQAPTACDFTGTASVVTSDPSKNGCTYPASASAAGTPTNGSSPGLTTTSNGAFGGTNTGLGPAGFNDGSHGTRPLTSIILSISSVIITVTAHNLL